MTDNNQTIVEDYMEAWTAGDGSSLERILDRSYTTPNPPPGLSGDRQGAIEGAKGFHTSFPDLKNEYQDWVIQGDKVVVRFVGTGTHKGEFMGIEPTNKPVEIKGIAIVTVRNGKVVSDVVEFDGVGLLTQIGALEQLAPN